MLTDLNLLATTRHDTGASLTSAQQEALHRAVAKIVALGAHSGVSPDQMIQLLKSGLTVGELLEYLASHSGEVA